jgi:hypothetical protein
MGIYPGIAFLKFPYKLKTFSAMSASDWMIKYFQAKKLYRTNFRDGSKLPLLEPAIIDGMFRVQKNSNGSVTLTATSKLQDTYFKTS